MRMMMLLRLTVMMVMMVVLGTVTVMVMTIMITISVQCISLPGLTVQFIYAWPQSCPSKLPQCQLSL